MSKKNHLTFNKRVTLTLVAPLTNFYRHTWVTISNVKNNIIISRIFSIFIGELDHMSAPSRVNNDANTKKKKKQKKEERERVYQLLVVVQITRKNSPWAAAICKAVLLWAEGRFTNSDTSSVLFVHCSSWRTISLWPFPTLIWRQVPLPASGRNSIRLIQRIEVNKKTNCSKLRTVISIMIFDSFS